MCANFWGMGVSKVRRHVFENVAKINIIEREVNFSKELTQQLPRGTNKRNSLPIFFRSRTFPNENYLCIWVSTPED
jgi:hypothetical protein